MTKHQQAPGVERPANPPDANPATSGVLAFLFVGGLAAGAFPLLLGVLLFDRFRLADPWHCFAICYLWTAPAASVTCYAAFHFRPSVRTAWISALASLAPVGSWFVMGSDALKGFFG